MEYLCGDLIYNVADISLENLGAEAVEVSGRGERGVIVVGDFSQKTSRCEGQGSQSYNVEREGGGGRQAGARLLCEDARGVMSGLAIRGLRRH